MNRVFAVVCTLLGLALFAGAGVGTVEAQAKKNQMVKGTIKDIQFDQNVLVVNQKVKGKVVDRELSILDSTEFVVMKGSEKKEASGKLGLRMLVLEKATGASVQVKCDKDVNVLKVTVKLK